MSALSIRNMNWTVGQRELEPLGPQTGEVFSPKEAARLLNLRAGALDISEQERLQCWTLADLRRLVESKEKAAKAEGDGGQHRDITGKKD
jgi:hypothetical protein